MSDFFEQIKKEEKKEKSENRKSNVRFCTNCGARLEEGDLFCTECGQKIELEFEQAEETKKARPISSDRMNSILNARKNMSQTFSDDLKNFLGEKQNFSAEITVSKKQQEKTSKKDDRLGWYVSKDSGKTEYFVIESIEGNSVSGKISDILKNGGYGNECFSGTINGSSIEINGIQRKNTNINFRWDLYFSGTINGNTISGKWDRIENGSEDIVYVKM